MAIITHTFEQLIDNADDRDEASIFLDQFEDADPEYIELLASLSLVVNYDNETVTYDSDSLPLLLAATRAADRMLDVMQRYIIVDAIDYNSAATMVLAMITCHVGDP